MPGPIAELLCHHLTQMAEAKYDAGQPLLSEHLKLVLEERPAGDWDEGFGNSFRDGTQASREAAGEQSDGQRMHGNRR